MIVVEVRQQKAQGFRIQTSRIRGFKLRIQQLISWWKKWKTMPLKFRPQLNPMCFFESLGVFSPEKKQLPLQQSRAILEACQLSEVFVGWDIPNSPRLLIHSAESELQQC